MFLKLFRKPKVARVDVILQLSAKDEWRMRDSFEGVQIFGGSGSGKTSGPGAMLARSYLRHGYGGLVLTTKIDELHLWQRYCQLTGRESDLLIVAPDQPWRFNFLDYECTRSGPGAGDTENLVRLFLTLLEATDPSKGGGSNDKFFERGASTLLRNTIDLLKMAGQQLTMRAIFQVITSAPIDADQISEAGWQRQSYCFECLTKAHQSAGQHADYVMVENFWLADYPNQDPRTRANVTQTFTTMADAFCRGHLRELFGTDLNFTPEDSFQGRIIILAMPSKEYGFTGRICQILFKYIWQAACERRDININPRPVFLWCDEAQEMIVSTDALFQATARSARVATVYLTQSLSAYHDRLGGGASAEAQTESLLGNLGTKIMAANSCTKTNEWLEKLINREWTYRAHTSVSHDNKHDGNHSSQSSGVNPSLESQILASQMTQLKRGGPENQYQVQALVFQTGRQFHMTGQPWMFVSFDQRAI